MSLPRNAMSGRNASFLIASAGSGYPYVPPRRPSLDDFNDLQWLAVSTRISITRAVLDAANRLYKEDKLGHGGGRNVINNQKCRCINARGAVYMIQKMRAENINVNPTGIHGASYYVDVKVCEYKCKDSSQIQRLRAWDAHTIAVVAVCRGGTNRASIVLEYDYWISGAPKVYPGGGGMSSSHEGRVDDSMYHRTEYDAQGSFDDNDCNSIW